MKELVTEARVAHTSQACASSQLITARHDGHRHHRRTDTYRYRSIHTTHTYIHRFIK